MKKNEIIELNGIEYTLELNRDSAIQIEKYTDMQKSIKIIEKEVYTHVEEIAEDEDPFADVVSFEEIEDEANKKLEVLKKMITRAFWIWLYPNHKLNINQVTEIIEPYFVEDTKTQFICEKYGEFFELSTKISQKHIEEQKKLKALTNK